MERDRVPMVGGPCGYRWPSMDGSDMHGCALPPGHREPWESRELTRHWCTCDDTWMERHSD